MRLSGRFIAILGAAAALACSAPSAGRPAPASGSTHFILDGNRIYAELAFVRRDGSLRRTLAYVDMGSPAMSVSAPLLKELGADSAHPVAFRIGGFPVTVPAAAIEPDPGPPGHAGGRPVEAMLAAGVLARFELALDYRRRILTLARPGALRPSGIATPFHLDSKTGLIAVDARIDGRPYALTIDNGSAWTWVRQSEVRAWLARHGDWARGVGAVGASNMMMVGDLEAAGLLARVPALRIGRLTLRDVDLLGPGPTTAFPFDLFDWYSRKNAVPVLGWIGGNVLKGFRITVDYPGHILYWQRQAPPDRRELNQVGLVLRRDHGAYRVAGIAARRGRPTVAGIRPGDRLIAIDGRPLTGASLGTVFAMLHGAPGARRMLRVERDGETLTFEARVTAF
ncbi:MAG TPA: PDZ domain-containing protein [Allosphingosinicella sp.]|nr:PDZ domain-containing protein [Allosphingosinicella sp.]